MLTEMASGAVPFSLMLTPGLEEALVGPITKTPGHVTRSVPDSTVRVTSGVFDASSRRKVNTMLPSLGLAVGRPDAPGTLGFPPRMNSAPLGSPSSSGSASGEAAAPERLKLEA